MLTRFTAGVAMIVLSSIMVFGRQQPEQPPPPAQPQPQQQAQPQEQPQQQAQPQEQPKPPKRPQPPAQQPQAQPQQQPESQPQPVEPQQQPPAQQPQPQPQQQPESQPQPAQPQQQAPAQQPQPQPQQQPESQPQLAQPQPQAPAQQPQPQPQQQPESQPETVQPQQAPAQQPQAQPQRQPESQQQPQPQQQPQEQPLPNQQPQQPQSPQTLPAANYPTQPAQAVAFAATPGPKKPGVVRIGVVLPVTELQNGGPALNEAIRGLLISYLNGPAAEAIPLDGRIPVQVEVESKQKECDFIFYSAVRRRQRSSGLSTFLKSATPLIGMIPGGGAPATAAGAAGTATATDQVLRTATDVSGAIKAKDEVSVEFKLAAQGTVAPKAANVLKATASKDSDDVLSKLLAQAANAALQVVIQK